MLSHARDLLSPASIFGSAKSSAKTKTGSEDHQLVGDAAKSKYKSEKDKKIKKNVKRKNRSKANEGDKRDDEGFVISALSKAGKKGAGKLNKGDVSSLKVTQNQNGSFVNANVSAPNVGPTSVPTDANETKLSLNATCETAPTTRPPKQAESDQANDRSRQQSRRSGSSSGGDLSSGYLSQMNGGLAAKLSSQEKTVLGAKSNENMFYMMQNGDTERDTDSKRHRHHYQFVEGNNFRPHHQNQYPPAMPLQTYHSNSMASSSLAGFRMVPMMIDDEEGEDAERGGGVCNGDEFAVDDENGDDSDGERRHRMMAEVAAEIGHSLCNGAADLDFQRHESYQLMIDGLKRRQHLRLQQRQLKHHQHRHHQQQSHPHLRQQADDDKLSLLMLRSNNSKGDHHLSLPAEIATSSLGQCADSLESTIEPIVDSTGRYRNAHSGHPERRHEGMPAFALAHDCDSGLDRASLSNQSKYLTHRGQADSANDFDGPLMLARGTTASHNHLRQQSIDDGQTETTATLRYGCASGSEYFEPTANPNKHRLHSNPSTAIYQQPANNDHIDTYNRLHRLQQQQQRYLVSLERKKHNYHGTASTNLQKQQHRTRSLLQFNPHLVTNRAKILTNSNKPQPPLPPPPELSRAQPLSTSETVEQQIRGQIHQFDQLKLNYAAPYYKSYHDYQDQNGNFQMSAAVTNLHNQHRPTHPISSLQLNSRVGLAHEPKQDRELGLGKNNNQLMAAQYNTHHTTTRDRAMRRTNGPSPLPSGAEGGDGGHTLSPNLVAISSSSGRDQNNDPGQLPQVMGCCGKMAKFLLFIANILFWSAGIALGAWGILTLVEDHKYNLSQLLVFETNSRMSLFQLLAWSFITLGCATILIGICGCSAMFKNSRWILGLYIFLILAIFALDLATGLLAMIFQERLVANVRLRLVNKLRNEYGIQASFTAAIDYIQTRYECCGLDGHFNYDQSLWRLQRLGGFEATVARTCCHLRNTFDDQAHVNPRPVNESMCQSTDVRFHQSYRYRRGCLDDLERLIRHKIWTFTVGCGVVGAIILLVLALATCFCRSIPAPKKPKSGDGLPTNTYRKDDSNRVRQQAIAYVENASKKQGYSHHHHHHQSQHSTSSHHR